ncbi:MAG: hypothetical protein JRD94_07940 [Deltaproteobacteria bacterium]|nr:hypothetical protein [Deltaproteobacteria bacterium]
MPTCSGHAVPLFPTHLFAARTGQAADALARERGIPAVPPRKHELGALQIGRCDQEPIEICHRVDARSEEEQLPVGNTLQKAGDIRGKRRFTHAPHVDAEGQLSTGRDAGGAGEGRSGDRACISVSVSVGVSVSVSVGVSVGASVRVSVGASVREHRDAGV